MAKKPMFLIENIGLQEKDFLFPKHFFQPCDFLDKNLHHLVDLAVDDPQHYAEHHKQKRNHEKEKALGEYKNAVHCCWKHSHQGGQEQSSQEKQTRCYKQNGRAGFEPIR